jgi:hypothetical protein
VRPDGESAGRHRSGFGIERRVRVLSDATLAVNGGRFTIPAFGLHGGSPGTRNQWMVLRDGVEINPFDEVQGKVRSFPLHAGDVVIMRSSAGGSVGDPLTRDLHRVEQDVSEGYVSLERARNVYGVVIEAGKANPTATEAQRRKLAALRRYFRIEAEAEDTFDSDGLRRCRMNPQAAALLGAKEGSLVEYRSAVGAPLRAWVTLVASGEADTLSLGPVGLSILRVQSGERLELRLL